ncbi:hypothetical protein ACFLY7_01555, partial [Patescibacteria group bacterium]
IFEIGKVFWLEDKDIKEKFVFVGSIGRKKPTKDQKKDWFVEIKGVLETVFEELKIKEEIVFEKGSENISAIIKIDGKNIGSVFLSGVFEIDVETLVSYAQKFKLYKTSSKYPSIGRDIALFVPTETEAGVVEEEIKKSAGELLVDLKLFDIFQKPDSDKKSLAFSLVLQSNERTLSDEEANGVNSNVIESLEKNKGWEVRK